MNRCHGDDGFGPTLDYNFHCYHFDFTLYFEECIFSLVPAILAITLALLRIYSVLGRPRTIEWPVGRALKLVRMSSSRSTRVTRSANHTIDCLYGAGNFPGYAYHTLESWLRIPDAAHHTIECYRFGKYPDSRCSVKPGTQSSIATVLCGPGVLFLHFCARPASRPDSMAAQRQCHFGVPGDSDFGLEASDSRVGVHPQVSPSAKQRTHHIAFGEMRPFWQVFAAMAHSAASARLRQGFGCE